MVLNQAYWSTRKLNQPSTVRLSTQKNIVLKIWVELYDQLKMNVDTNGRSKIISELIGRCLLVYYSIKKVNVIKINYFNPSTSKGLNQIIV